MPKKWIILEITNFNAAIGDRNEIIDIIEMSIYFKSHCLYYIEK